MAGNVSLTVVKGLSLDALYYLKNKILAEANTYTNNQINDLVDGAPAALDTLNEIALKLSCDGDMISSLLTTIDNKVDKEAGKGLSTNDYTTTEKNKLANIAAGAEVNVQSDWNLTTTTADDYIKNKPTNVSAFTNDSGYITSSYIIDGDAAYGEHDKAPSGYSVNAKLSGKQDTLSSGVNIKTINNQSLLGSGNITISAGSNVSVTQSPSTGNTYITVGSYQYEITSDVDPGGSSSAFVAPTWNATINLLKLSDDYVPSVLENEDLELSPNDTYEVAFGKLHKAILDNELITSASLIDLNNRVSALDEAGYLTTETDPTVLTWAKSPISISGNSNFSPLALAFDEPFCLSNTSIKLHTTDSNHQVNIASILGTADFIYNLGGWEHAGDDVTLMTMGAMKQRFAVKDSPALTGTPTAPTASSGTNTTQIATTAFVQDAVNSLPEPMIFKGSLGSEGTITQLPAASADNEGFTYKVITAGTYASQTAKVGDTFISDGTTWVCIPSGDEPNGTVTSITLRANSPLSVSSTAALTTSGTRTITHLNSGVTAGTYKSVTVNATGHVTGGTNPTTLAGYGITDAATKKEVEDNELVVAAALNDLNDRVGTDVFTLAYNDVTWTEDPVEFGDISIALTGTLNDVTLYNNIKASIDSGKQVRLKSFINPNSGADIEFTLNTVENEAFIFNCAIELFGQRTLVSITFLPSGGNIAILHQYSAILWEDIDSAINKANSALQSTDIKDELDPGGNGEIADSAAIAAYIDEATLSTFTLTLTASHPVGWYRVMGLGQYFSGIVTLSGDYYSAAPSIATFAIGARVTDTANDIVQINGSKNTNIDKIRLVSNEDGDHRFYLDVHKATSNNCNKVIVTFNGYASLTDEVTNTVLSDVASTYIRKTFDLINGSSFGNITASKFITNGGTSSQFVKGDGTLDSNTYATRDNAVCGGDYITNSNSANTGSTKKDIFINHINDRLYAANSRFYVTHKVFDSSDDSFVKDLSTNVFSGNLEQHGNTISEGQYAELYIGTEPEATLGTNSSMLWTYGNEVLYLTFYIGRYPDNIDEAKLYHKYSPAGWDSCTITKISNTVYKIVLPNKTYPAAIKIKWSGSSSRLVSLSDVKAFGGRSTLDTEGVVTKYGIKQDLWGDVEAPKFIKRGGTSSQFLKADGSVDSTTYQAQLVSGTNIKTINNQSLLGSGNITIQGGGGDTNVIETVKVNNTALTPVNKAVNITVPVYLDDLLGSSSSIHVSQDAFDAKGTYSKPSGGIPKTDLAGAVQTSLGLADTALQPSAIVDNTSFSSEHSKAPSGYAVSAALQGKADSATTLAGYGITDAKIESGTITLGSNTITPLTSHLSIKTINGSTITGTGNVTIATPGTLKSDNTTAQTTANNESLSGIVNLHKISKTGNYNDLIDKPTIPSAVTESTVSGWGFTKNEGIVTSVEVNGVTASLDAGGCVSIEAITGVNYASHPIAVTNGVVDILAAILTEINASKVTIYSGTATPSNSLGTNGDLYLQTS